MNYLVLAGVSIAAALALLELILYRIKVRRRRSEKQRRQQMREQSAERLGRLLELQEQCKAFEG